MASNYELSMPLFWFAFCIVTDRQKTFQISSSWDLLFNRPILLIKSMRQYYRVCHLVLHWEISPIEKAFFILLIFVIGMHGNWFSLCYNDLKWSFFSVFRRVWNRTGSRRQHNCLQWSLCLMHRSADVCNNINTNIVRCQLVFCIIKFYRDSTALSTMWICMQRKQQNRSQR